MSDEVTRPLVQAVSRWKKRAETAERALAVDAETIQRLTSEVHQLKDAGEQLIAECNRVSAERDTARVEVAIVSAERDTARAEVVIVIAERDAAERERTESRAEVVRLRLECEGLRADLMAHPPEHAARIAELQATTETLREDGKNCEAEYVVQRDKIVELQADLAQVRYERDTALAGCKERQAANAALWEAQQDMRRKADHDQMIIEGLRECLERTEKRYIEAKARQVPRALVGLLGVIRREAAAAEKMIL